MRRVIIAWIRFWRSDKSLSALLLMLVIVAFILPPLAMGDGRAGVLPDVIFTLLLASGIAAAWHSRRAVFIAILIVSILALTVRWLSRDPSMGQLSSWSSASNLIVLAAFALVVLGKVVSSGTITSHRIQGAVAVYLLFGLVWANAYEWMEVTHPGAFSGAITHGASWIYYSFVTLTTMGYGDIIPVHPGARSLAAAEALTGQLYIAILVARLVALELATRDRKA